MRKKMLIIFGLLLCVATTNAQLATVLKFNTDTEGENVDSVKFSPLWKVDYPIYFAHSVESDIDWFSVDMLQGKNKLYLSDGVTEVVLGSAYKVIPMESMESATNVFQLKFVPTDTGLSQFRVQIQHTTGKIYTYDFRIVAFGNMKPIAKFELVPVKVLSPYQYEFDATDATDADKRFGGGIRQYRYSITYTFDGQPITQTIYTQNRKIEYAFSNLCQYDITLEVQDNEGDWSDPFSISTKIN